MDYERNARYFKHEEPTSNGIVFYYIFMLILFFILAYVKSFLALIPLALFIIPLVLKFVSKPDKPTDAEIEEQFAGMMINLKEQALKKLGIEEEEVGVSPPIYIRGYLFGNRVLRDEANLNAINILGQDKQWRSPEVVLTIWMFSENQIYYYERIVSFVSDTVKETTNEMYYRDVVSVKTDNIERPWIDPSTGRESKELKTTTTQFVLRNAGGEEIRCSCYDSGKADEAVHAMRNLLRQKKLQN